MSLLFRFFLVFVLVVASAEDALESVDDAELGRLIEQEQYVIVLKPSTNVEDTCTNDFEVELAAVRENLVDSINAWVVKTSADSALVGRVLGPEASSACKVVFFRKGAAVLYDGPADEEELLERLSAYKETCVRELSDASFEHLTQASTGATTGDWFVLFVKRESCDACEAIEAAIETVACNLKGRMNVARIDRETTGAVTGRRFGVSSVPSAIFFRLGKMYRFDSIGKFDVKSITAFIQGFYKNVKAESIPLPKTPL